MLSVIIPSYKDKYLNQTIQSLLDNATGEIEVIPVLDGYWQEVLKDPRVHPIHLHKNGGQKNATNTGMAMARGEFVARTDEHCLFAPGFDTELTSNCEENWVVSPRRYFLNPETWSVMDEDFVDYEKLIIIRKPYKFTGHKWKDRTAERLNVPIDENMMIQGSFWMMRKSWWDNVIKGTTTEGYGPHYQDQLEIVMKTWQAGGKLMINKNTWYAHKHRSFARTHNYGGEEARKCFEHSINVWKDYYKKVIRPKWNV